MQEIPKMISSKDLSYIEDMLNWNMVYSKKCHMYKSMVKNKEIKKLINEIGKMHTNHYNAFLEILKKG